MAHTRGQAGCYLCPLRSPVVEAPFIEALQTRPGSLACTLVCRMK